MIYLSVTLADVTTTHHCHTPEIDLTSATSGTGIWAMEDMLLRWRDGNEQHSNGHYHETYSKASAASLIASSTLTRLRMDFTAAPTTTPAP